MPNIPLTVKPNENAIPSFKEKDFLDYHLEYLLPDPSQENNTDNNEPVMDRLRIIANLDKKTTQIILITNNAEIIKNMPGIRPSSLIADTISRIHDYLVRSDSYPNKTPPQQAKYDLANNCITKLQSLLVREKGLACNNWSEQEALRRDTIALIEEARDANRLIAVNPIISEGKLGNLLYEARQAAQHYRFNRTAPVSAKDQQDFTGEGKKLVWDSEMHDDAEIENVIREICRQYKLKPAKKLTIHANRFQRLAAFMHNLWLEGREWADQLSSKNHQPQIKEIEAADSLEKESYFSFQGLEQESSSENKSIPVPSGDDLLTLCNLSKHRLFLPERIFLQIKAFFLAIPDFFVTLYEKLKEFVNRDVIESFDNHINADEPDAVPKAKEEIKVSSKEIDLTLLREYLIKNQMMKETESLEDFVKNTLATHALVMPEHAPSLLPYNNPFHRTFGLTRHLAEVFVNHSVQNPICGLLAMIAYAFGAGAVLAPQTIAALFTLLKAKSLLPTISHAAKIGEVMCKGSTSQALSSAITLWQGVVIAGDPDKYFMSCLEVVKDNPVQTALIIGFALALGVGLGKTLPFLIEEMGPFPYPNYLAAGAKAGAAIYDTATNPGDDWLLGTLKWLLNIGLIATKIIVGPFVEGYRYGFKGFLNGWKKSAALLWKTTKQTLSAGLDLLLAIATIPLMEIPAMFIHVPFKGVSNLLIKTFVTLGNWQATGEVLLAFAHRDYETYFSGFRLSPLYGFTSPENYTTYPLLNYPLAVLVLPLELIKNLVVLPLLDLSSLTVRLALEITNIPTRAIGFMLGNVLTYGGMVWDVSIGNIFQTLALGIAYSTNWVDKQAGGARQWLLSQVQIGRAGMYYWAFNEDEVKTEVDAGKKHLFQHPDSMLKMLSMFKENPLVNSANNNSLEIFPSEQETGNLITPASNEEDFYLPQTGVYSPNL